MAEENINVLGRQRIYDMAARVEEQRKVIFDAMGMIECAKAAIPLTEFEHVIRTLGLAHATLDNAAGELDPVYFEEKEHIFPSS